MIRGRIISRGASRRRRWCTSIVFQGRRHLPRFSVEDGHQANDLAKLRRNSLVSINPQLSPTLLLSAILLPVSPAECMIFLSAPDCLSVCALLVPRAFGRQRVLKTEHIVMDELDQLWVPEVKDWRLNERHYGDCIGETRHEILPWRSTWVVRMGSPL